MANKIDIINGAYSILRISGLTVNPTPEDVEVALDVLEDMAAEFDEKNICLNWNFEDTPDPSSEAGMKRQFNGSMKELLAYRMAVHFGKEPTQILMQLQMKAMSFLSSATAKVRQTQYPRTQPRGSGNTFRNTRWQRFNHPQDRAPISCDTKVITLGGILDFVSDFSYWLNGEAIQSYTTSVSNNIKILSDSESNGEISYRVECDEDAGSFEFIDFKLTTDTGRVQTFRVNFNPVSEVENG